MQVLPLLVQLPDLRPQGTVYQHVHLSALRHEPALGSGHKLLTKFIML
jgi:hypothetical protein